MASDPSLTARRVAQTRREIAVVAADLFARRGARDVTVDDIAAGAGISPRTFYRYFPTKQDAVVPILTAGAAEWHAAIAAAPASVAATDAVRDAIGTVFATAAADADPAALERTRGLLRSAEQNAGLQDAWRRVNGDSEIRVREVLAARLGSAVPPLELRLVASSATQAVRVAMEAWAAGETGDADVGAIARDAFDRLTANLDLSA